MVAGVIREPALPDKPEGHCRKADARMCLYMAGRPGEMRVTPSVGCGGAGGGFQGSLGVR